MVLQKRNFLFVFLRINFPPLSLPLFNCFTLQLPLSHLSSKLRLSLHLLQPIGVMWPCKQVDTEPFSPAWSLAGDLAIHYDCSKAENW